jgi:putative oxidoreductase
MDKLARNVLAPLLLRLGLAVIFIFHGMGKLGPNNGWGTDWDKSKKMHVAAQVPVAWGELLGGVALALGFLARLAALGLAIIMVGAISVIHPANGFDYRNGGSEYNFCLLAICLAVICLGGGPLALDHWLWRKKPAPAAVPPAPQR